MKILYGVCGEGFGHSSRAKEIISLLKKKGHKVLILTYGQAYEVLKKESEILEIEGVTLQFKNNRLSIPRTLARSTTAIYQNIKNWKKIKSKVKEFNPDLCIADMEPTAPILSRWLKIPLISIDNQHRLTHLRVKFPEELRTSYNLARLAVKSCISKADHFIILSFTKRKTRRSNTTIVPPIIRKEITKLKPKNKDHVLVYLTKPNPNLLNILKQIPENFIIYGYDKKEKESNLNFKKFSKSNSNFLKDLENCKAIIATSGFTLISESLYLKKPCFAIPLQGQFEQALNALFLKRSWLGTFSENPTKTQIKNFLKKLDKYRKKLKSYELNPEEPLKTIEKYIRQIPSKK